MFKSVGKIKICKCWKIGDILTMYGTGRVVRLSMKLFNRGYMPVGVVIK